MFKCSLVSWSLACAVASMLAVSDARSAPVSYNFSGTVEFVTPGLSPTIAVNNTFAGGFTFDSTTPPNVVDLNQQVFNALTDFHFSINGLVGTYGGSQEIQVDNDVTGCALCGDRYFVFARSPIGTAINSQALVDFSILLFDATASAFSDTSLVQNLVLSAFGIKGFTATYEGGNRFEGRIDSLTQTPLPGALPLFAAGLAGLIVALRRRRKQAA